LFAIHTALWFTYSDVLEHRMDRKHTLTNEWKRLVDQSVLFLKTENEYHGPKNFVSLSAPFKRIWRWLRGENPPEIIGPAWPFDSAEQLDAARDSVFRS
jgi:hypothetical protein